MKKIRNWLVVLLLVPCMVMLAACGGSGSKKKDTDDGGNTGGNTDDWFSSVAAEVRGKKLAPSFDDIMPGVLVGGQVSASPATSVSSSSLRNLFMPSNFKDNSEESQDPCLLHGIVNCQEVDCLSAIITQHTIASSDLISSTRNNDIKWIMESYEDMVGSGEGSTTWMFVDMFLNSGLTEKDVWQEVGDTFIDWYIGSMSYMFDSDYMPSQDDIQRMIDQLIRMASDGVYFKYEEVGNDKIFYGYVPFAGGKIMLSLKGNGAVELFSSNDRVCSPNNLCNEDCNGNESVGGYNYMYYHNNRLVSVNYNNWTSDGKTDEQMDYWEFEKENGESIGKTVYLSSNHYEDGTIGTRVEARNIQGNDDSISMRTYYEFSQGDHNYSTYTITTLVDGVVMTLGENEAGDITNLYFDAKAFENLGNITYVRVERQETWLQHEENCGVHDFTWDDACNKNCGDNPDNIHTQIKHNYRCGYYTGNWEDLCNNDNCEEVTYTYHSGVCGIYWDQVNGYQCTCGEFQGSYINHVNDGVSSCRLATGNWSWDDLCNMGCSETSTWINHVWNSEDNRCGVYTAQRDNFCSLNCKDNPDNWHTETIVNFRLKEIVGMNANNYNYFNLENKYEYKKVIEDGIEYWKWTPSQTELYAYFEIGSWGNNASVVGQITDIEQYLHDNFDGLQLKEGFSDAFNNNRGGIKQFFGTFSIDGFDSSLDGKLVSIENYDLFKIALTNFLASHDFDMTIA